MASDLLTIDVHLAGDAAIRALRDDVRRGLTADQKWLPPKWFYDDRGSQLFDEITRLDEYYPTRAERAILVSHAHEIATTTAADTLVELGSGTSEKTRLLLDALRDHGALSRFVPFDVSEQTLRDAAESIRGEYPGVMVHAVVGDFEHHLATIPRAGRRCIAFLGGTVGNLFPAERARFFGEIAAGMSPVDSFLLGTDLVKDPERLVAAYDDPGGVTADFNKNVLRVVNRELGADFDVDEFDHVARFDPEEAWIEMRLRSRKAQSVRIRKLDLTVTFAAGEELRTEISAKFRADQLEAELLAVGLVVRDRWTDPAGDFALTLATTSSSTI
jgi:L-histidine Nalpha-methyltransferase